MACRISRALTAFSVRCQNEMLACIQFKTTDTHRPNVPACRAVRSDDALPSESKGRKMTRLIATLTLDDAKLMLSAAEAKAAEFSIAYNVAVVDAGGHLIAFVRQDDALIGSIDLAIKKAVTTRLFDKKTDYLAKLAQPGAPLFGIDQSNDGNVVIFGGGLPVIRDGRLIGAVGASAGSVEQDIAVAQAAVSAIDLMPADSQLLTSGKEQRR